MNVERLRASFGDLSEEAKLEGCRAELQRELEETGNPKAEKLLATMTTWPVAEAWLSYVVRHKLLARGRYAAAGHLLWGPERFDVRPKCVRTILSTLQSHSKIIILGSASAGKSYTCIAFCIMEWIKNPYYTAVRIISTTAKHALTNTFSHMQAFYDESVIKLPGFARHGFIGISKKVMHSSVHVVAIKEGDTNKNALQGLHPVRIPGGGISTIRVLVDEGEMVGVGVWRGAYNLLAPAEGNDTVKVIFACNPVDITSALAANAEPVRGWSSLDIDTDFSWESKSRWHVERLDGAQMENVVQRKTCHPTFLTYQGFEDYRMKGGREYYSYARGIYCPDGVDDAIIPYALIDRMWGNWIFAPGPETFECASLDVAHEGDDLAILCVGKFGRAIGLQSANGGQIVKIEKPRLCLQIYQFHKIQKGMCEAMYNEVRALLAKYGILPYYTAIDKSGNGYGVYCQFSERGEDVLGVSWGAAASDTKVLDIHKHKASELYDGCSAEMYHAFKEWLSADLIRCSPAISSNDRFIKGLTSRKYKPGRRIGSAGEVLQRIEDKPSLKQRLGWSPDHADSAVQLLMLARQRNSEGAAAKTPWRKVFVPGSVPGEESFAATRMIDWTE